MPVSAKVYVAVVGDEYEPGINVGVYGDIDKAKQGLSDCRRGRDYEGVEVYELNGGRLWEDPDDYIIWFR